MVCADHGAYLLNLSLRETAESGEKLAQAIRHSYEIYHYDMVLVFSDPYVEAQAMGCPVELDPYPTLLGPAAKPSIDRTQEIIHAAEILKKELDVPIFVSIKGPFTLAAFLAGIEYFLKTLLKNENETAQFLQEALRYQLRYLDRLLPLGVNIMIGDPLASSSVISPSIFSKHAFRGIKTLVKKAKTRGAVVAVHICGEVEPISKYLDDLTADILSIENIEIRTKTLKMGGVGTGTILKGDPARIRSEIENAFKNKSIILSTACDVPPHTNPTNIKTMLRIASECSRKYGVQE
jgi:uroporphyrinogen decarboxylase